MQKPEKGPKTAKTIKNYMNIPNKLNTVKGTGFGTNQINSFFKCDKNVSLLSKV